MSDSEQSKASKRNRGPESNDTILFGTVKHINRLRLAFEDINALLSKGYPLAPCMTLVGNHHKLNKRQRAALSRACASSQGVEAIKNNELSAEQLAGQEIWIDGFNLLILMESALSGAFIFDCADGALRDLSSVHGSYKRVSQTENALKQIGETLKKFQVGQVHWVLDSPVSNSGRLKQFIAEVSEAEKFEWDILLDHNPDHFVVERSGVVISSDSWVILRSQWFNLGRYLIENNPQPTQLLSFIAQ